MAKKSSKMSLKAISISLLFFLSSLGSPVLMSATNASSDSPVALAATPLTQLQANWAAANGDQFNTGFNPQNQINSSNAQYLGLSWLFPLPTHPTALLSVSGGLGVDTAPLIINGTIYAVTQFDQAFALNAANGNVLWTTVLPVYPNSTAGKGVGAVSLHLHDGNEQFTTKLFNHTPTWWISADDLKVYAINALNGQIMFNYSDFDGINTVAGNNPGSVYHGTGATNVLVDQNKGIAITSVISTNIADTGRCFFRGWNILVNPPTLMWTAFCTPPQPGSNIPVDPSWEIGQVNSMKGAEIFYPGPSANGGGYIPNDHGQAVVNLKTLSPSVLNSTLYNDWGYFNESPFCAAYSGGGPTGSTAAGWGAPWLLGAGPTAGLAFVNTNNKDPYSTPCAPGPSLWSVAILALNETNGQWVWGFQAKAHETWDWDCSWWQGLGNETIGGVNTQVLWKTCKDGYIYELNAQTGNLIWAWTPPLNILARCPYCFSHDPLNATQMNLPFFNPSLQPAICTPCSFAFESEAAYSPVTNYIYVVSSNNPQLWRYVPMNLTNYHTNNGNAAFPPPGAKGTEGTFDNSTAEAVDAATGQMVWSHFIPTQGYRGGIATSGNIVFLTLSSGDLLMLNAKSGDTVKDYYIGGPLNVHASIGATAGGTMEVILPITAGLVSWGTGVPGDIVALTLQNVPAATTNTVTTSVTVSGQPAITTSVTTVTAGGGGVDTTTAYGIAAVAVIFIIATGYLALRGRKPTP